MRKMDERSSFASTQGTSPQYISDESTVILPISSLSTTQPILIIILSILVMSLISGQLRSVTLSSVNIHAASSGRTLFLAALTSMLPSKGLPPSIMYLLIFISPNSMARSK